MKGVVLCAGLSTRLKPCTNVISKHLLPVYNKPMVYYPLKTIRDMGITEALVIFGEYSMELIQLLRGGSEFDLNISYKYQEKPEGVPQALLEAESFAAGEDLVVILGDNIFLDDIELKSPPHLYLTNSDTPEQFGVVEFYGEKIKSIEEKPQNPKSKFVVTGLYVYPNDVFNVIRKIEPKDISDVNRHYLKDITYTLLNHPWIDTGTFDNLFAANETVRLASKKE